MVVRKSLIETIHQIAGVPCILKIAYSPELRLRLIMPDWCSKLIRRLRALTPGRYLVIITIGTKGADWTVLKMGKVER